MQNGEKKSNYLLGKPVVISKPGGEKTGKLAKKCFKKQLFPNYC